MKLIKTIIFINLIFLSSFLFAQETITKNLGDFSTVKVFNGIEVELIHSKEQKIEISGYKADKVKVVNNNGTLKVSLKLPEISADGEAKAKIYFNTLLKTIDANEGATITGKNFNQDTIEAKVQEGAFMNLVINTTHAKIKASSGGVVKISGTTKSESVKVDLGGTYHGFNLKTEGLTNVKAGSGAKAEVNAGETLDAKVSFGGTILYKGNPKVLNDKKVLGGIIKKRD